MKLVIFWEDNILPHKEVLKIVAFPEKSSYDRDCGMEVAVWRRILWLLAGVQPGVWPLSLPPSLGLKLPCWNETKN
jgi:hypothetical protein